MARFCFLILAIISSTVHAEVKWLSNFIQCRQKIGLQKTYITDNKITLKDGNDYAEYVGGFLEWADNRAKPMDMYLYTKGNIYLLHPKVNWDRKREYIPKHGTIDVKVKFDVLGSPIYIRGTKIGSQFYFEIKKNPADLEPGEAIDLVENFETVSPKTVDAELFRKDKEQELAILLKRIRGSGPFNQCKKLYQNYHGSEALENVFRDSDIPKDPKTPTIPTRATSAT